jgi:hypothetical protein
MQQRLDKGRASNLFGNHNLNTLDDNDVGNCMHAIS